ncbi:MAG: hypothetical protein AB7P49_20875 [Bdellovibrionales bacterium]
MVDLFEQRYRINGQIYTHDWDGKADIQRDLIKGALGRAIRTGAIPVQRAFDLLFPRAEANPLLAVPIAMQICVEGGCALAVILAQRAAVYVANNPAVAATAATAVGAFRTTLMSSMSAATRTSYEVAKNVIMEVYTHPATTATVRTSVKAGKALLTPPLKAIAWFSKEAYNSVIKPALLGSTLFTVGYVGREIVNNLDVPFDVMARCLANEKTISECAEAKKKKEALVPTGKEVDVLKPRCPSAAINEFQVFEVQGDNRVVIAYRIGTEGENKGLPLSAIRYVIRANNQVDLSSIRSYKFEKTDVSRIARPEFFQSTSANDAFLPDIKNIKDPASEIKAKIIERDKFISNSSVSETIILEGVKKIKEYTKDPLTSDADPEKKRLDEEVALARKVEEAFQKNASECPKEEAKPATAATTPPSGGPKPEAAK